MTVKSGHYYFLEGVAVEFKIFDEYGQKFDGHTGVARKIMYSRNLQTGTIDVRIQLDSFPQDKPKVGGLGS